MFDLVTYLVGFFLFFGAACTKGILGFGVNFIAVPIMSLFVGPRTAIVLVNLPGLINNIVLIAQRREPEGLSLLKRITPLLITGAIGVSLGSILLVTLDTSLLSIWLGILTLVFVLTDRWRANWQLPSRHERILGPIAGFGAGLLNGVSGVSTPVLVSYLYSLRLSKQHFVYVITIVFIVLNLAQGINLLLLGLFTPQIVLISVSYLIPIIIGTLIGTRLQDQVSQKLFNNLVLGALFLIGLDLIRHGLHLG